MERMNLRFTFQRCTRLLNSGLLISLDIQFLGGCFVRREHYKLHRDPHWLAMLFPFEYAEKVHDL